MKAEEIRQHQFAKRPLGYDPAEVRGFLESVAMGLEHSQQKIDEAARRIAEFESQVKDCQALESSLRQALVQAQEAGVAAAENGRREAHALIREAEAKASVIVERSRTELASVQEQITILRAKKDSIVARLRMLLQSELDLLKALELNAVGTSRHDGTAAQPGLSSAQTAAEADEIIRALDGI